MFPFMADYRSEQDPRAWGGPAHAKVSARKRQSRVQARNSDYNKPGTSYCTLSLAFPGLRRQVLDLSISSLPSTVTWVAGSPLLPIRLSLLALGGQPECGHLPTSKKEWARDLGQTKKVAVPDNEYGDRTGSWPGLWQVPLRAARCLGLPVPLLQRQASRKKKTGNCLAQASFIWSCFFLQDSNNPFCP